MTVRAEFYHKGDGHLVGLRGFGYVTKEELKPNEKSTFKVYEVVGETGEFLKANFVVKAKGDGTNTHQINLEESADNVTRDLTSSRTEIVINVK